MENILTHAKSKQSKAWVKYTTNRNGDSDGDGGGDGDGDPPNCSTARTAENVQTASWKPKFRTLSIYRVLHQRCICATVTM